jgi:hypothetical protein
LDDGFTAADQSITDDYDSVFRFYLGFAIAGTDTATGEALQSNVYYGWAQFEYSDGEISVVSSALNTTGGGIYAGTDRTTSVPEPASGALALLGAVLLLRRRGTGRRAARFRF